MLAVLDEFGARRMARSAAAVAVFCSVGATWAAASPPAGTPEAARAAHAVFAGAEERFQPPRAGWFDETQQALKAEVERVGLALDSHRAEDALFWKTHLRWELLERNLGAASTVNVGELEVVRRWMYSNRAGLEWRFFAPLRSAMDAHLDAAYTTLQPDLQTAFNEHVALARSQCLALAEDPSDGNAAALGRTLGWFERTGQLAPELAAVRSLTSLPNAQFVLDGALISRIVATHAITISETIPLSELVEIPPGSPLGRTRAMRVRGTATTAGNVQIVPTPNEQVAEVSLVYEGSVESSARGETGPVTIRLTATGTAQAVKPVYVGPQGLELGETKVTPSVTSRVTGVVAERDVVESIARRRVGQEDSQSLMNAKARSTTVKQLSARLDQRVEEAVEQIRADVRRFRSSLGEMGDVTAPLSREGAELYFDGARSTADSIELNAFSRRREQHGAAAPCPAPPFSADIQVRVHASFFNNLAETILGGKTLSDKFIMKYGKVIHAELPLPLMVHSRAPRWALTMAKHRPLELQITDANRIAFIVRIDAVEIDGVTSAAGTTAVVKYRLLQDEFGDYRLERDESVELASTLPTGIREFAREKIAALFGPVLSGGGVVVPEGGALGALHGLQSQGVHAERDWVVAGWNVPAKVVEEFLRSQQGQADSLALDVQRPPDETQQTAVSTK